MARALALVLAACTLAALTLAAATAPTVVLPLRRAPGSHLFLVPVTLSGGQESWLIADTGSGNLMVFRASYCAASRVEHASSGCFNATGMALSLPMLFGLLIDDYGPIVSVRSGAPLATPRDVKVYVGSEESTEYWNGTAGTLGIGPPAVSYRYASAFWTMMAAANATAFALDLADPDNSTLLLGGPDRAVTWSATTPLSTLEYYFFSVYRLTLCGVEILGNYSSSWPVLPDTGTECLGLPAEFFDMVAAWLPGRCEPHGRRLRCLLTPDDVARFPALYYRLDEGVGAPGPPGAGWFAAPLSLLLDAVAGGTADARGAAPHTLCMVRRDGLDAPVWPFLHFGARVLRAVHVAFDPARRRVGLADRAAALYNASAPPACAPRAVCPPTQAYYAPGNACLPPACASGIYMDYDAATGRCTPSLAAVLSWGAALLVGAAGEMWLARRRRRLALRLARARRSE